MLQHLARIAGRCRAAAAQLHELAERASRRNLRIGYEALAWGKWVNLYKQAWAIVEKADHPHLGLILDSFHPCRCATTRWALPTFRRAHLLCADGRCAAAGHGRDPVGAPPPQLSRPGAAGCGDVFEQALLAGYTGNLSLEIFNDVFRETPNRRTALDAMRSLLFWRANARTA